MKKTFITTVLSVVALVSSGQSVLTLGHDYTSDSTLVELNDYERRTIELMESWYSRERDALDRESDMLAADSLTEQVYIDRLSKLPTEVDMTYNSEVRSQINGYCRQRQSRGTGSILGRSLYYMPIFEEALERHGVPNELKCLAVIESALNPKAISVVGAAGPWQFMEETGAKMRGLLILDNRGRVVKKNSRSRYHNYFFDERLDPVRSADAAVQHLKYLKNYFGKRGYDDWLLAVAAYNCGEGNVDKAIRRSGLADSPEKVNAWSIYHLLPQETRGYIPAFIAANYTMNYYHEHNINPIVPARPIVVDSVHVTKRVHLGQISEVLGIPLQDLQALNPQYSKNIIRDDSRVYPLVLPIHHVASYIAYEDSIINYRTDYYNGRRTTKQNDDDTKLADNQVVTQHKVKKGETLSKIADQYGVTVDMLVELNPNINPDRLEKGQIINVATEVEGKIIEHKVKKGETLNEIAEQYGVTVESIKTINPGLNPNKIKKNQIIKIAVAEDSSTSATGGSGSTKIIHHTVKKGEQLGFIAEHYGVGLSTVISLNPDIDPDKIQAGSVLKIAVPVTDTIKEHTVKKGETYQKIANQYGVTIESLKESNPDVDPGKLQVGQVIKVAVPASSDSEESTDTIQAVTPTEEVVEEMTVVDDAATEIIEHEIKKGEQLGFIAEHYGVGLSTVIKLNPHVDPDNIKVGQVLKIRVPVKNVIKEHTVKKGETYKKIAKQYGVTVESLEESNPGVDPGKLKVGQVIKVVVPASSVSAENEAVAEEPVNRNEKPAEPSASSSGDRIIEHKIKKGEQLGFIAEHYGVGLSTVIKLNPHVDPNNIKVGQVLKIRIPAEDPNITKHTVKNGESLGRIANKYNVTVSAIKECNPGLTDKIQPGQVIKVPSSSASPSEAVYVTVKRGDSLSELAEKHGTTRAKIRQLNNLSDDNIKIGQRLRVK